MACVSYNVSSKITFTYQDPGYCATACIAMCVNKSLAKLKEDGKNNGFSTTSPDFATIASFYGYSLDKKDSDITLTTILNHLKDGYPVVVEIKNSDGPHWVVITKYSGDNVDVRAAGFTCADPDSGKGANTLFINAARYGDGTIYRSRAFIKN